MVMGVGRFRGGYVVVGRGVCWCRVDLLWSRSVALFVLCAVCMFFVVRALLPSLGLVVVGGVGRITQYQLGTPFFAIYNTGSPLSVF